MANSNEYMRIYMANRRTERRIKLMQYLGDCCINCGSEESLEFDHIDAATKSFIISGFNLDKSWAKLLLEVKKCQLLCTACHNDKTKNNHEHSGGHNKILKPVHGTAHMYVVYKCRCIDCKYARSLYRNEQLGYNEQVAAPSTYECKRGRPISR